VSSAKSDETQLGMSEGLLKPRPVGSGIEVAITEQRGH
jgi:hypothetical protein